MKISILTDNCAGSGFLAEHGLSYFIESNGKKVLLDTGHTDVFLRNANKIGIDIQKEIDTIILSHGHWDHGDGLRYLKGQNLILHPQAFIKRYREKDKSYIGLNLSKEEITKTFNLIETKDSYKVTNNIIFLGEIPRETEFESKTTTFIDENGKPDTVPDDSALAIIENNELIIVTGCSHSGICNIINYAREITGLKKIRAVIGGFHLKKDNKQTKETIHFFKEQNIAKIFPSHCTQLEALIAFSRELNFKQIKTGMTIVI